MSSFSSFDELRQCVSENGDLLTVSVKQLRDILGMSRAKAKVRTDIAQSLDSFGLKAYPRDIPGDQNAQVRVYLASSAVADLIDAVLNPTSAHDAELRSFLQGSDRDIINQIKRIVCD